MKGYVIGLLVILCGLTLPAQTIVTASIEAMTPQMVALSFESTPDSAVTHYQIIRNNIRVGRLTQAQAGCFVDCAIPANSTFTYQIQALNATQQVVAQVNLPPVTPGLGEQVVYVNALQGDDENNGTSPALAKKTIQAAMHVCLENGTVCIAPGTYLEHLQFVRALTLFGQGAQGSVIIDAGGVANQVGLTLTAIAGRVVLDNLVIRNSQNLLGNGGALRVENTSLIVTRCAFLQNTARHGAGAYLSGTGRPVFVSCLFEGNVSVDDGGAVYAQQVAPLILNCRFNQNISGTHGGGIHLQ